MVAMVGVDAVVYWVWMMVEWSPASAVVEVGAVGYWAWMMVEGRPAWTPLRHGSRIGCSRL